MNPLLISVIVPAYNAERFLLEAIRSIESQNYPRLQLIVVDDGSTDRTAEIAKSFGDKVEYIYQTNRGPAAARNRGMHLARGEFIAFLDADDVWMADKLREQLAFLMRDEECDVILGRMQYVWLDGAEQPDPLHDAPSTGVNVGAGLFRRRVFNRVGTFDETLRFAEDHDWFLRAREAAVSIRVLDRAVLLYRRHGQNMTADPKASRLPIVGVLQRSLQRRRAQVNGQVKALSNWNDLDKARCPLVTVVIPTFNGERRIAAALSSAWGQNYRPIDLVVVDDGSTDNTVAAVESVPHVRVIKQSHQGVAAARNAGLEAARSEIVAFLDQDVLWLPNKLRKQVDVLLDEPELGFAFCEQLPQKEVPAKADGVGGQKSPVAEDSPHVSSLVVRKWVFQRIGVFDGRSLCASETDWFLRAKNNRIPMKILREALFTRQLNDGHCLTANTIENQLTAYGSNQ
jgi:glycosyltransferase involved in cell wall biosynthesis